MRQGRSAGIVLGLAGLAFTAGSAEACKCVPGMTPAKAFRGADAVVLGEVLSVEGDPWAQGGAVATLRTARSWKEGLSGTLQVETRTSCAFDFRPGETYLVYLSRSQGRAAFSTMACNGNEASREAGPALEWLDRHGGARPPSR